MMPPHAFWLFGAACLSLSAQPAMAPSGPSVPSVSVCQVLAEPLKFDGRLIELTGVQEGTDEGAWLAGPECPGVLKTLGYVWPSIIYLQMPDSPLCLHAVDFKYDFRSQKRVDQKYGALHRKFPDRCIVWKYTGLLETRADWSAATAVYPNGTRKLVGFGHVDAAPAQLLLKQIDDVVVIPDCGPASGVKPRQERK